jgi:carbon-monoxide dehydrogenase iron sulfur subunit
MRKVIVVDEERCLGCKSCVIQCAMAHTDAKTLVEALGLEQRPQARVHVEPVGEYAMPLQCQHCEDAPCVSVCPTKAIAFGPDGNPPVLMDRDRCIGCRFCVVVCPFGVIDMSRDGKVAVKCDLCVRRTEAGEEPACVAGCPTGALEFSDVEEYLRIRRREAVERLREGRTTAEEGSRRRP